jgi:integrase/recombinase XerD
MHRETTANGGEVLFDARGYRRSPATLPGHGKGRAPRNKGRRYPATAPTPEDVAQLLAACPDTMPGRRLYALVVVLFSTGLRIGEALKLEENDLDADRKSIRVRNGKGGKSRTVGMNDWGWRGLQDWLVTREQFPAGPVFCIVMGPTQGCGWDESCARRVIRQLTRDAGIRKRLHPHSFRHAFTCEAMRNGGRLELLQRQLGHASLDNTAKYFASINDTEVVDHFAALPAPVMTIPNRKKNGPS